MNFLWTFKVNKDVHGKHKYCNKCKNSSFCACWLEVLFFHYDIVIKIETMHCIVNFCTWFWNVNPKFFLDFSIPVKGYDLISEFYLMRIVSFTLIVTAFVSDCKPINWDSVLWWVENLLSSSFPFLFKKSCSIHNRLLLLTLLQRTGN